MKLTVRVEEGVRKETVLGNSDQETTSVFVCRMHEGSKPSARRPRDARHESGSWAREKEMTALSTNGHEFSDHFIGPCWLGTEHQD